MLSDATGRDLIASLMASVDSERLVLMHVRNGTMVSPRPENSRLHGGSSLEYSCEAGNNAGLPEILVQSGAVFVLCIILVAIP